MVFAAPADASSMASDSGISQAVPHRPAAEKVLVNCVNDIGDPVVGKLKGKHYVEFYAYTKCVPKNNSHLERIYIGHRLQEWQRNGGPGGKPGWVTVSENGCPKPGVANSRLDCYGSKVCTPLKSGTSSYVQDMFTLVEVEWKGKDYLYRFPDGWQQGDDVDLSCRV